MLERAVSEMANERVRVEVKTMERRECIERKRERESEKGRERVRERE